MTSSIVLALALSPAAQASPPGHVTGVLEANPDAVVVAAGYGTSAALESSLGHAHRLRIVSDQTAAETALRGAEVREDGSPVCTLFMRLDTGRWESHLGEGCTPASARPAVAADHAPPPAVGTEEAAPVPDEAVAEEAVAEEAVAEEAVAEEAVAEEAVAEEAVAEEAVAPPESPAGWRDLERESDPSAMILYGAAYGAYAGGMTGWLIGEAMEAYEDGHTTEGAIPGVIGGAAAGATTAALVGRRGDRTREATALLYSGTGLGMYYGDQLGRVLIPTDAPGAPERARAAGLAGTMAGVGASLAFSDRAAPVDHQVNFAVANGAGWLAGRGVMDLAEVDRSKQRQAVAATELGTSVGFGALSAVANQHGMERLQGTTLTVAGADGLWFGTWAPYLFTDAPTGRQVAGGAQVGLGVGYLSALGMASFGQPSGRSAALQGVGLAAGSALGAGIPMSVGSDGPARAVVAPMMAVGAAGQGLGAALAPRYELGANDGILLATLGSWTAYQTYGWSVYGAQTGATEQQALGYALSAGGAGTLATMAMLPVLEVSPEGSAMLMSGGAWGTWFGAWGSQIAKADGDTTWLATLAAGDGALIGTAVAQGVGWKPTWRQVGTVNGYGLLGAAAGGLAGAIALYNPDDWTPVSSAIVVGSAGGLVTGSVISALPGQGAQARKAREPRGPLAGVQAKLPFHTSVQATPWAGEDGDPGVWVQLDLAEK